MEEAERIGLTGRLKKSRMYAQFNYQEWRYPRKERAIDVSSTKMVFREYKPKDDMMTRLRAPRKEFEDLRTDKMSHRQIKKRVPTFHRRRFPAEAHEIYIKAHELLNTENWTLPKKQDTEEALHGLVTEFAYPTMLEGLDVKTINWKFVETIEPPRTVQIICLPMMHDENFYGQVTVRFHTRQLLTIHDRFGRLMVGSPDVARDILEYVTFERHVVDPYGKWRIHAKRAAQNKSIDEIEKTVAIVRRKPQRSEAEEWKKEQVEDHRYIWFPKREVLLRRKNRAARPYIGAQELQRRKKWRVLNILKPRKLRMKRKYLRVVSRKSAKVYEMRQRGELPSPPA
uniref:39S ribosomal protein L45, mitochondrial-like n=1 Tax=Styela clava TaxID=7725 RepID=UPI0019396F6D|nr:39S ribosomal protein L45, mitochondrial-like [Styela clava]